MLQLLCVSVVVSSNNEQFSCQYLKQEQPTGIVRCIALILRGEL